MKESELNELCNKYGLRNYDFFVNFFMQRFPNESMESYVCEWIKRFKSGNPTIYMDKNTYGIYVSLIFENYMNVMEG